MTTTTTRPKSTKKFQALVAVVGDEAKAIVTWNALNPDNPIDPPVAKVEVDPQIAQLLEAGFDLAEAQAVLNGDVAAKADEPAPVTSKDYADAAVAKSGLTHFRGRVYSDPDLIEAQVRVLKTGKPEVVLNAGETKTKGVVVYRTDDGTKVVMQNLGVAS